MSDLSQILFGVVLLCGGLAMLLAGVSGWRASRRRVAELDQLLAAARAQAAAVKEEQDDAS